MKKHLTIASILCLTLTVSAQTNLERLTAHTAEFEKGVIEVTEGVYVAVGYALANSILIEGDDGIIIVDTTENPVAAKEIMVEFRKITDKPVKAIIYTHFHADHILGARTVAGDDNPQVFAHALNQTLAQQSYGLLQQIITTRSVRQFGVFLPKGGMINCGIGPRLRASGASADTYLPPTTTVGEDPLEVTVAGVRMKMVHAVGETDDQIYIYLPDKKVLLPGDNFYKAFPNLYAIRGTKYRDVRKWADSLDLMLNEDIEFLVPSHTRPIAGKQEITQRLTNYRDAIRFVHDKTVEGINQNMTPDALVDFVKLPDHLAADPYLAEYYGTVEWSVRSIYHGYLGWFDGNPASLFPLTNAERSERLQKLIGSEKLLLAAQEAFDEGDYRWTLELTNWLREMDPDSEDIKGLRKRAARALANQQISANGRNYLLTAAQQGL
jgi:alkyl sulfatase BDS1-like metallo-beta-lactamase superfamily hydrolase